MHKRTIIIALIAGTAGIGGGLVAAAPNPTTHSKSRHAPPPARSTRPDAKSDEVHVTVTAGRGRLGFAALEISPELRKHLGAPDDRGVLVDHIRPGSPAERAGLQVGDVITDVDGDPCESASDVLGAISDRKKGDQVTIEVARGATHTQLQATLDDDPGAASQSFGTADPKLWEQFRHMPFDMSPMFDNKDLRGELDELRDQIERLERRVETQGRPRT